MDVAYFLAERTQFIRGFYENAIAGFVERKRLIEVEDPPFEPPYSEDGEPAFLDEWLEADAAIELVGRACVSMLSDSLKLYLMEWERQLGLACQKGSKKTFKTQGFFHGYRLCFEHYTRRPWSDGPFDLDVIEQVILARNDAQHPKYITDLGAQHHGSLKGDRRSLFFAHEHEMQLVGEGGFSGLSIMSPTLHIPKARLFEALENVESLARWLEPQLFGVKYPG